MAGFAWPPQAAEQATELSSALFNEAGDGLLLVDPENEQVLAANPLALFMTHLTEEEIRAVQVRTLLRHERGEDLWLQPLHETQVFHGKEDFLLRVGDGQRWMPVGLSISRLHVSGAQPLALLHLRDHREHKATVRRLRKTEADLTRVLESVSDCIWKARIDAQGRWRYQLVSPVMEKISGRRASQFETETSSWEDMVAPDDLADWKAFRAKVASGLGGELEYRIKHPRGHVVWVRESVTCSRGEPTGTWFLHGVLTDVTPRREAWQAHFEKNLLEAQKLETIGGLAGGVAHAFNNHFTGILGNASLAHGLCKHEPVISGYLEQIESIVLRAAELNKQLLAYAGKGRFVTEPSNLNELIENTQPLLKLSMAARARLHLELDPQVPIVNVDGAQIRQVLMNLVANASEALGDQPGNVRVTTGRFRVDRDVSGSDAETLPDVWLVAPVASVVLPPNGETSLPMGEYATLQVSDDGPGMTPEVRARIFEPFYSSRFAGRGLGLAAVLGIVRIHQGAIQVESQPGTGTTVRIYLPKANGSVPKPKSLTPPPPTRRSEGVVLLVEEERGVRESTASLLTAEGYEVLATDDGHEAMALFQKQAGKTQVVLLDVTMPKLGGAGLLKQLRALQPSLPVVLMSGYPEADVRNRLGPGYSMVFLAKPFRPAELRNALRKALAGV